MSSNSLSPSRSHEFSQRGLGISPLSQAPPASQKTPLPHGYANAKVQMVNHGRGLIKMRHIRDGSTHSSAGKLLDLPPQQVAEHAIILYRDCFHRQFPALDWPTFQQTCESLYARQRTSEEAVSIFFCVLAYGTLCSQRPNKLSEGMEYIKKANSAQDFTRQVDSIDGVVLSLLTGIFFVERGSIAIAWVWLGNAIRIAQNLNIHLHTGQSETSEQESRIWYTLYCWDR